MILPTVHKLLLEYSNYRPKKLEKLKNKPLSIFFDIYFIKEDSIMMTHALNQSSAIVR